MLFEVTESEPVSPDQFPLAESTASSVLGGVLVDDPTMMSGRPSPFMSATIAPVFAPLFTKDTGVFHVEVLVQPAPLLMYDPFCEMMLAAPLPVTSTRR